MIGKEKLRDFVMGQSKHLWTETIDLMGTSIDTAGDTKNIATDTRVLKELLHGYKWALQQGYQGD